MRDEPVYPSPDLDAQALFDKLRNEHPDEVGKERPEDAILFFFLSLYIYIYKHVRVD